MRWIEEKMRERERGGEVEPLWADQNQPFKSGGIGGGTAGCFTKFVKFTFWTLTSNLIGI